MHKVFIPAILAMLCSLPLQAKQPEAPNLTPIIEQLQLDRDQAARLTQLVAQHYAQMRERRQQMQEQKRDQNKQAPRQQREDRFALRQQHRENLLSLLNHEQLYHFENYMHEQRRQRREQRQAKQPQN